MLSSCTETILKTSAAFWEVGVIIHCQSGEKSAGTRTSSNELSNLISSCPARSVSIDATAQPGTLAINLSISVSAEVHMDWPDIRTRSSQPSSRTSVSDSIARHIGGGILNSSLQPIPVLTARLTTAASNRRRRTLSAISRESVRVDVVVISQDLMCDGCHPGVTF